MRLKNVLTPLALPQIINQQITFTSVNPITNLQKIATLITNQTTQLLNENDTFIDASGNELKINRKKNMTDREKKTAIKKLMKKLKKDKTLSQEDRWEIEDQIEELQK